MSFFINDRQVGPNCPPLIIAELGINHGGSLKVAKEMVDAAKRAGVEVKASNSYNRGRNVFGS